MPAPHNEIEVAVTKKLRSAAGEFGHHRSERLDIGCTHDDVAEAPALASLEQVFDDLARRSDESKRSLRNHRGVDTHHRSDTGHGIVRRVRDIHKKGAHVHLDGRKAISGSCVHDRDFFIDGFCCHRRNRIWSDDPCSHGSVDADDVGFSGRNRQNTLASASDENRRARCLDGFWGAVVVRDRVVVAGERERLRAHSALDDVEAFHESIDTHLGRIVRNAELFVVADHPPGSDAEFEAPIGQDVHRRKFLREHGGMLVVVVPYECADAQNVGDICCAHQCRDRSELIVEMVRHRQARVAVGLGSASEVRPFLARTGLRGLDTEAERSKRQCHTCDGTRTR